MGQAQNKRLKRNNLTTQNKQVLNTTNTNTADPYQLVILKQVLQI